jgi:hypothetical protein
MATKQGSSEDLFAESGQRLKFCVERGRLLDLLNDATRNYAQAVQEFIDRSRTLAPADYVRLRIAIDQAHADAEHCREALHQHRREHGC